MTRSRLCARRLRGPEHGCAGRGQRPVGTGLGDRDLLLEAVFEETAIKQEVFAAAEEIVRADCIFATNTSALSVTELGRNLDHPERLVGMHFFNPARRWMLLVELVRTEATDDVDTWRRPAR